MLRQGDVLLIPLGEAQAPVDGKKADVRDHGRIVLAYGEVTGHAHAIHSKSADLFTVDGERFLRVKRKANLTHEEHGTIVLEKGDYRVVRQREYSPEAIRKRLAPGRSGSKKKSTSQSVRRRRL